MFLPERVFGPRLVKHTIEVIEWCSFGFMTPPLTRFVTLVSLTLKFHVG